MADYDLETILPHHGEMILLDEVAAARETSLSARLVVRDDGLFSTDGRVPAVVGIEYMAQAIAAFAGARAVANDEAVKIGLLLGTRNYRSSVSFFEAGTTLAIEVSLVLEGGNGLAVFDCEISGADVEVSARLTVLTIESLDAVR